MFFGLINSLVTFQTMMNKILWNLINTSKVASFINNIIIGTEEEEEHDELVEEVIRRLAENDLYVKLEKCKQKIRKVEFLGVMIEPEGIKIEEDKIKSILDWLTPKYVKDVQKFLGLVCYKLKILELIKRKNLVQDLHKKTQQRTPYRIVYLIY